MSPAAIDACTSVIFLDPLNDGAFVNRGIAYRRAGELELAIRDYDRAIRLNPRHAHAYNNRGVIFLEKGEPGLAAADFSQAIERDGRYANAFRNRGLARTDQRLFDLAIQDFERAYMLNRDIEPGPEYAVALFGRGIMRRRNGVAGGDADIDEATRLLPDVADVMASEGVR